MMLNYHELLLLDIQRAQNLAGKAVAQFFEVQGFSCCFSSAWGVALFHGHNLNPGARYSLKGPRGGVIAPLQQIAQQQLREAARHMRHVFMYARLKTSSFAFHCASCRSLRKPRGWPCTVAVCMAGFVLPLAPLSGLSTFGTARGPAQVGLT